MDCQQEKGFKFCLLMDMLMLIVFELFLTHHIVILTLSNPFLESYPLESARTVMGKHFEEMLVKKANLLSLLMIPRSIEKLLTLEL